MMDIAFYQLNPDKKRSDVINLVEIGDDTYRTLALSLFSKIGSSRPFSGIIDGEEVSFTAVELTQEIRRDLIQVFRSLLLEISQKIDNAEFRVLEESKEKYAPYIEQYTALINNLSDTYNTHMDRV